MHVCMCVYIVKQKKKQKKTMENHVKNKTNKAKIDGRYM